jgi:hypothetical protein
MGWIVSALTIASVALLVLHRRSGWTVGIVAQGAWIVLIVTRAQWDLSPVPIVMLGLHVAGYVQSAPKRRRA